MYIKTFRNKIETNYNKKRKLYVVIFFATNIKIFDYIKVKIKSDLYII